MCLIEISELKELFMIVQLKKVLCGCLIFLCVFSFSFAADELVFNSNKVDIHYTDTEGEGVPIVLLHGYTMSLDMWHETGIVDSLSKDYRVITIDLRGHGKSGKPTNSHDYGPKVGIDVINLLDHLKIPKSHLMGYSMGAFVVGRLLVTHPERILSATLASGSFPLSNEEEADFQESTAKDMEAHGNKALASVARGWAFDSITVEQISNILTPIQAIFGSEEVGDFYYAQQKMLQKPKNSRPILLIEGADHDSKNAAVLHPKFLNEAKKFISSIQKN